MNKIKEYFPIPFGSLIKSFKSLLKKYSIGINATVINCVPLFDHNCMIERDARQLTIMVKENMVIIMSLFLVKYNNCVHFLICDEINTI